MGYTAAALAATLAASPESDYVRVVADWMVHGEVAGVPPPRSDIAVVDALTAAAVAHLARSSHQPVPAWTNRPERALESFWHPGSDAFFSYALANSPAEFRARGILIEQDSLVCV